MDNSSGKWGWVITDGNGNIVDDNNGKLYHSDYYDENGIYTSTKTARESQAYMDGRKLLGITAQELNEKALKDFTPIYMDELSTLGPTKIVTYGLGNPL